MEANITKLYLNEMSQQNMYKIFGLRKVTKSESLEEWQKNLPEIEEREKIVIDTYQNILIDNIDGWNEQELSLGFIEPILNLVNFRIPYQLNFFAQRPISAIIGEYELYGKPDGLIASGFHEPEEPYFSFQEYKKDMNSSGDAAGQNLAAMYVGQHLNEKNDVIYGCYVVGRLWYFMVLQNKEYAISKAYTADDEEILVIFQILKKLRQTLHSKIKNN